MAIEIKRHEERPIDTEQLPALFAAAFWGHKRTPEGLAEVLKRCVSVGVWDGERLIGFGRAISDGKYRAYVEDIVISPDYRGQGVGERMVEALVEALGTVEIVSLFCLPERVPFYSRNGFRADDKQVMMHRGEER